MPSVLEVPEPDLSMEVQDQPRSSLSEIEVTLFSALDEEQETPVPGAASSRTFASSAVGGIFRMLRKVNHQVTREALSDSIHGMVHSEALVGHISKRSHEALHKFIPCDRAAWLAHDIEGHAATVSQRLSLLRASLVRTLYLARIKSLELVTDRGTHMVMLSAGGGAVVAGCTGGVVGTCGGAVAGTIAGVVPSFLTLGLSIPAGTVVGGGAGGCLGAAAGTLSGLVGGGVACRYRSEIRDGAVNVKVKIVLAKARAGEKVQEIQTVANSFTDSAKVRAVGTMQALSDATSEAAGRAKVSGRRVATNVYSKTADLGASAKALALNPAAQATSAGAAGGAVAGGAAGGALGLVAGGASGGAVGLVPALFTLGLSIPVCAAIGSGAGACLGAAAGGATGFVGGGAVGYGAYSTYLQRAEIRHGASEAFAKLTSMAESAKETATEKAHTSASFIKAKISGTGGTQ